MVMVRKAAFAGPFAFYPSNRKELERTIQTLVEKRPVRIKKGPAKAVILPHAGYIYSGRVAAHTVSAAELKETIIIMGPNHTGLGEHFSVMVDGRWQTPLGDIEIDVPLARAIVKNSEYLKEDFLAHKQEHSIEVLLPLLQWTQKTFKMVPIVVSRANCAVYQRIAQEIVGTLCQLDLVDEVSVVASSDMTHFESQESASKKDHYAIESIIKLNPDEMIERIEEKGITMCGAAPVAIMLNMAKELGASQAKLVEYQTSGDVTGDYRSVVGYAGITIE